MRRARRKPTDDSTSGRARRADGGHATLQDVAAKAGVSTATVSRYLNMPELVGDGTRQKVESAINALRYKPHAAARALASRRSRLIGAVIPTAAYSIFGDFIHSLEEALFEVGYGLLLANSHYDRKRELQQAEQLLTRGVDGMVLVGDDHPGELHQWLNDEAIPYIKTWVYLPDSPHPCVGFDGPETAYRLADYLVGLGHRDFAMIAGKTALTDRAAQRVRGIRRALHDHGLQLPESRIIECPYDIHAGRDAMRMLTTGASLPSAIICGNDVLAFGALFESRSRGIAVPDDISITGFDNHALASQLSPPLTTVVVPAAAMGRRAAEYLIATLDGRPSPDKIRLDAELVVRGTTGAPRTRDRPTQAAHVSSPTATEVE